MSNVDIRHSQTRAASAAASGPFKVTWPASVQGGYIKVTWDVRKGVNYMARNTQRRRLEPGSMRTAKIEMQVQLPRALSRVTWSGEVEGRWLRGDESDMRWTHGRDQATCM